MSGFIDIHSHLAWDIDDGMDTQENCIVVLKNAKADGIKTIFATPHFVPGIMDRDMVMNMHSRIEELSIISNSIGIEIMQGCELFLNDQYLEAIDSELYQTLGNSDYLLVEFDVRKNMKFNDDAEDVFYELLLRKFKPVIAHVERYFPDGVDLKRVEKWIEMGCIVQINRTSLLGFHGKTALKNANALISEGLAHIVASDAHRHSGNRICSLSDVYEKLCDDYGKDTANTLCSTNPLHIKYNEDMERIKKTKKSSLFNKIWKRGN